VLFYSLTCAKFRKKERKLHQTGSNFRTGNSDLDGKHLPERCSNSVPPVRTDNYRNAVPAPKCLPEQRSGVFRHNYTTVGELVSAVQVVVNMGTLTLVWRMMAVKPFDVDVIFK